jgi:Flp pilus assembly pilin Flp
MKRIRDAAIRVHLSWLRFRTDERGAQTLEWLALALLVLAIIGTVSATAGDGEFGKALREKFLGLVNKIDGGTAPAP